MKRYSIVLALLILLPVSCTKEAGADYRDPYTGTFTFTVERQFWSIDPRGNKRDTVTFDGTVRLFANGDDLKDLNDFEEVKDGDRRITIEFLKGEIITTELSETGEFTETGAPHYHHAGGFSSKDIVAFVVDGLGGLGAGLNYRVKGARKVM